MSTICTQLHVAGYLKTVSEHTFNVYIHGLLKAAGAAKTFEILLRRAIGLRGVVSVNIEGCRLEVRPRDSDLFALSQIFGWQE